MPNEGFKTKNMSTAQSYKSRPHFRSIYARNGPPCTSAHLSLSFATTEQAGNGRQTDFKGLMSFRYKTKQDKKAKINTKQKRKVKASKQANAAEREEE